MEIHIESASENKKLATTNAGNIVFPHSTIKADVVLHSVGDVATIKSALTQKACKEGSKNRARRMNVDPILENGTIAIGIHKSIIVYKGKKKRVTFGLAVSGFIIKKGAVKFVTCFTETQVTFPELAEQLLKMKSSGKEIKNVGPIDIRDKTKPFYESLTGQSEVPWIQKQVQKVLSKLKATLS